MVRKKSIGWGLAVFCLASSALAFPSWMGVYGTYQRHNGGNPGLFTILMNQDYPGLQAEVGIQIQLDGHPDNGMWNTYDMSYVGHVDGNSMWQYAPDTAFPEGAHVAFYFHGMDEWGGHIYDSDQGNNYALSTGGGGGSVPELWVGNTSNWPWDGDVDEGDVLWIDTVTWPIAMGQAVTVHYRQDGGPWEARGADWHFNDTDSSHWHVDLGSFTAGSLVEYYVEATQDGALVVDDNEGSLFGVTVNQNTPPLSVGHTAPLPVDGELDEGETLSIHMQTWPIAWGQAVTVHYRVDSGPWQTASAGWDANVDGHSLWHADLGSFDANAVVEYFVEATQDGATVSDTNDGSNYTISVNGSGGGGHPPASATLAWDPPTQNVDGTPLNDLAGYKLYWGTTSGVYDEFVDVGAATMHTIDNLIAGQDYYFAATAYDHSGNESTFSLELTWSKTP
jgi:hypothetical protein